MKLETIIFVLVIGATLFLIASRKKMERPEFIDWLNINVTGAGNWTRLSDDELKTVYKGFAPVKIGVNPEAADYLNALEVLKKYNIQVVK